jgi:hypothetical protein
VARTSRPGITLSESAVRGKADCAANGSILVLDDGVRAVSASGGFRVPFALVILVFDGFRVAGDFLLLGSARRNRLFMAASHSLYSLYVNTQGAPDG